MLKAKPQVLPLCGSLAMHLSATLNWNIYCFLLDTCLVSSNTDLAYIHQELAKASKTVSLGNLPDWLGKQALALSADQDQLFAVEQQATCPQLYQDPQLISVHQQVNFLFS